VIPAGGRISFDEVSGFNNPLGSGFGLNKAGEQVFLSQLSGSSEDRVVDAVSFQGQENFVSLGRYPDGGEFWRHMPPTRDATNSPPLASIVINEFMYNPPRGDGQDDNTPDEFVELFNPTGASIDLFGPDGVWRMADGINFIFPPDTSLPAGGHLLLVNFDPADATLLNAFRTRYGISADVPVMGPYSGNLSNSGERVALEKPEAPDNPGDQYGWVIVDEVIYFDRAPFPPEADGNGPSLRRAFTAQSGNDPSNWASGAPTPGASNDTEVPVPSAPASLTAQADDTQITLEWTTSTWATSYRVKRATADGGPYTLLAMVTGTGHVDTNVSSGMTYFYVVSSVNAVGESLDSPQADATLPGPPPPAPTGLAATAGDGQVTLNWNTVPGVSGYNVKRSALSGSPYTTIAPNLTTTTYTDFDVANGSTYYYVVSAENANGEGPHSAEVNARPRGVTDASPYASAVAAANPIAYWRLDEMDDPSSGTTTAYDSWADFHGTFGSAALNGFHDIAGPRAADGWPAFGNANVALHSTADTGQSWVTLPPLGVTTDSATITAWVNPVSHPSFAGIVFYRSGGGSASGLNLRDNGELGYHWNDANDSWSWASGLFAPLNQWSFVALVVEPTQATMHVINSGGAQSATNAVAHSSRAFVDAMRVGGDPLGAGRTFDGRIDEVAFFDYALSPEQVQSLYAAALTPPVISLTIQRMGSDLWLTWPQGTLQQAAEVNGPYTNVLEATSPHTVSPTVPQSFFQIIMP
jgi:hypothetical protein